ncbi:MAG: ABC transporter ATP-binding protein [Nitrososphaerales archaeon]
MDSITLRTEDLHSGYGKITIVQGVSIKVPEKSIVTIIGPNGSGKSTLVKTIIGEVKTFGGKVIYQGQDITGLPTYKIVAKGIGYVPQVNNVFTNLTVEENLEMGAYLRKDKEGIKSDVEEIFEMFNEIKPYAKTKAATLSGGERQMLAVARAMINRPKLLILDEPTANLAPKAVALLHQKIKSICEQGVPILMVEQNVRKALQISDYTYVLGSGKCVYEGPSAQLLEAKDFGKIFLGIAKSSS